MVKYPAKFNHTELDKLSIEELKKLENSLYYDRKKVLTVLKYKKLQLEEE
jgi:hypothetical protein